MLPMRDQCILDLDFHSQQRRRIPTLIDRTRLRLLPSPLQKKSFFFYSIRSTRGKNEQKQKRKTKMLWWWLICLCLNTVSGIGVACVFPPFNASAFPVTNQRNSALRYQFTSGSVKNTDLEACWEIDAVPSVFAHIMQQLENAQICYALDDANVLERGLCLRPFLLPIFWDENREIVIGDDLSYVSGSEEENSVEDTTSTEEGSSEERIITQFPMTSVPGAFVLDTWPMAKRIWCPLFFEILNGNAQTLH